ncbi:MAG: HisA/HisF-related TIM barrel protein [Aggregatilineales bacterium]
MTFEVTRPGKNSLILDSPVMTAAGTFGYGDVYRDMVNIEKLGAIVTNPITYDGWSPTRSSRVVPLDAGVLIHTGLPNPGLNKVLRRYVPLWTLLPVPVIVHIVATTPDQVRKCASRLDEIESVQAIELGLADDITREEAEEFVKAAVARTDKPIMVRLPLQDAYEIAQPCQDAGAGALVVSAPPRGVARDKRTGRLVRGRVYAPIVKPMVLHVISQLVRRIEIPIIGSGGIHSPQDARDFLDAGARAVQVDSVTWIRPRILERIARDLGGGIVTRQVDALPDEWHADMGDTERQELRQSSGSMPSLSRK